MRVLLAENDLHAGQNLFCALKDAQYSVDWVRDGRAASLAIAASYYAVVLLNLGLPGIGGMAVLKASRAAGNKVPVMLLGAEDDPETHVRGLDIGADDCVLKPFVVRELLARIRAVVRRTTGYATSRIGDEFLGLDLEKRTMFLNGLESSLSAREFALMHALLQRRGAILSRRQLEERLYGWGKEVESNAVDVLIHSLRKKYGPSLIRNVRGLGWSVMSEESVTGMRRASQKSGS
jgi:two-component system, OmpR family, response regulator